MATATVELDIGDATLSGGLVKAESRGVVSAFVPAPLGERARGHRHLAGPPAARRRLLRLARYTTLDAKRVSLFWIECDGQNPLRGMDWRLRFPCTLTRHLDGVKPGDETWFTDKMQSGWWAVPSTP